MAQRWGEVHRDGSWHSQAQCLCSFLEHYFPHCQMINLQPSGFVFKIYFVIAIVAPLAFLFSCKSRSFFQNKNFSAQNHQVLVHKKIWNGDVWQKLQQIKRSVLKKMFSDTGSTFCLRRIFSDTLIRKWCRNIIEFLQKDRMPLPNFRVVRNFPKNLINPKRKKCPLGCW